MRTTTLIGLGVGGTSILTGTGVALSHFYGGESIRAYIEKTKKSQNKIFLVAGRSDLETIKTKYGGSTDSKRTKPKDKDGNPIDKEKLVQWCSDNANTKFSSIEDETYKAILSWCFLNSKTISEEMTFKSRELYSSEEATSTKWQEAWDKYSRNKATMNLIITVDSSNKLNSNDRVEGGKALHKWCNDMKNSTKKLYEDGEETNYELFDQWCTKDK